MNKVAMKTKVQYLLGISGNKCGRYMERKERERHLAP